MSDNPKFEQQKERLIRILTTMFDYLSLSGDFRVEEKGQRIVVKITSTDDAGRIIGRKGQTLEGLQLLLNRIMFKEDEECPRISLDIDGYSDGERERKRPERSAEGGEGSEAAPREAREPREPREPRGERGERRERPPRERSSRRFSRGGEGGGDRSFSRGFSQEELEQLARDKAKEVKRWGDPVKLPELNARDRRIVHMTLKDDPEIVTESEGEGAFKKVVISIRKEGETPAIPAELAEAAPAPAPAPAPEAAAPAAAPAAESAE